MPFYSKDWRSSGDAWVKTGQGWEKMKVLECSSRKIKRWNSNSESSNSSISVDSDACFDENEIPPHCHITIKCTKEVAGFNGLGEAVKRLDFRSSVRDRHRFHYICTLLKLLVTGNLSELPGGLQRFLLQIIEDVADYVSDSQQNFNILRGLVNQLQNLMTQENQKCWGKPLGSQTLWEQHVQTIQRIQNIASQITIKEPEPGIHPNFNDLPEECIREILLRISDHRDLEASSSAWTMMKSIVSEQRIWRELTNYHFTSQQIDNVLTKKNFGKRKNIKDWKKVYHELKKVYGFREDLQYTEILFFCRFCCCLFWPRQGHPCIIDGNPDFRERFIEAGGSIECQPVPPAQFLKYFSFY